MLHEILISCKLHPILYTVGFYLIPKSQNICSAPSGPFSQILSHIMQYCCMVTVKCQAVFVATYYVLHLESSPNEDYMYHAENNTVAVRKAGVTVVITIIERSLVQVYI
jgi:hypothetical protein